MYDNDTKKIIEEVRNVCDLKSAAKLIKQEGGVVTGVKLSGKFAESAKKLTPTLSDIDPAVLGDAFKKCILKLESNVAKMSKYDIDEIDCKELIKFFLNNNFEDIDIKLVIHCFCVAAIKFSVESSVESLVSRYESHFTKGRQLGEEEADFEMYISENGPLLHKADPIIKRSLDSYFKEHNKGRFGMSGGKWHFITTGSVLPNQQKSKTVERQLKWQSKLPF